MWFGPASWKKLCFLRKKRVSSRKGRRVCSQKPRITELPRTAVVAPQQVRGDGCLY